MTTIVAIFCCFLILTVGFVTGLQFGKATAYSEGYADALCDEDEDHTQFPFNDYDQPLKANL